MSNDKDMLTGDDITDAELQALQNQIDAEIGEHGLPTDDKCRKEIEKLNASRYPLKQT